MRRALKLLRALVEIMFRPGVPRWKILTVKIYRLAGGRRLARGFFTRISDSTWDLIRSREPARLKIAVTREGTVGDKIGLMAFLRGLRARFPGARIVAFDWDINAKYYEVFEGTDLLDGLALSAHEVVGDLLQLAARGGAFDLVMENRYVVRTTAGRDSRAPADYLDDVARRFREFDTGFDRFPRNLNALARRFPERTNYELMGETAGLAVDLAAAPLPVRDEDLLARRKIRSPRYVTIHHGAGPTAWGEVNGQTKMWFAARWAEVVAHLNRLGLEVVQLGLAHEERLAGANVDFLGRTTFHQSAAILRDALFHLDTEGGLVHAARAVGTKSLVLFGPTPIGFFGYRENVNLARGTCHDCWWTTDAWQTKCPVGHRVPKCMDSISVDDVIAEIDRLVGER